ncbi:MAG: hypothetical protein WC518_01485 [Patescibacteria group bacterium]
MKKIIFILVLTLVVFIGLNFTAPLRIQGDGVFYYSWLHSSWFDHDLDFRNQLEHYSSYDVASRWFLEKNITTPLGRVPNAYAYGAALMWLPFFLIAHPLSLVFQGVNQSLFAADGYSYFYNLFLNFGSWFYSSLALIFCFKILKRFFSERTAFLSALAIYLATPWFYYQNFEPFMAHSVSLFLVSVWLYLMVRLWHKEKVNHWLLIFILFLMCATRWQNLFFAAAYLPIFFFPLPEGETKRGWEKRCLFFFKKISILVVPIILFALSQAIIWGRLYGQYLLVPQGHRFLRPEFHGLYTLFSSDHGLLLWSPILILALIGLYWLWKKSKFLTGIVLAVFICQWLINSSLNDLGGGDAFGGRRFIETLPFLALALAALIEKIKKHYWQAFVVIIIFIGWNFLLLENYRLQTIPHAGHFDFFQVNFFQVVGRDINRFIISKF